MRNISRLFAGSDTQSRDNVFWLAKLKLTAFFAGTILLIVILFSVGVYLLFYNNLEVDLQYEGPSGTSEYELEQELVASVRNKLLVSLIVVDLAAVVMAAAAGWFLAGKTLAPIQATLRNHKRFVSDTAHELRTPLSIMKAGMEMMELENGSELKDYRLLNTQMLEETDRLVSLTNDLLFLSRRDQPFAEEPRERIDVAAICERRIAKVLPYARQKGVQLESDIESPLHIMGNREYFDRLLSNLLKNAVDYNVEGGRVSVSAKDLNQKAILEVTDTGVGIAKEHLPHVLKRFYKADEARARSSSGSGLGLSIVEEIAKYHEGKISITSEVNKGTNVKIIFDSA